MVDQHEPTALFALMSMLTLPALGLGIQLYSQFRGPGSRLMPGFAAAHVLVGIVLAVGPVVLMAARLIREPGASLAGSLLLPSTVVSVVLACTVSIAAGGWHQVETNRGAKLTIVVSVFLLITPVGLSCALYSQTLRQRLLAANDPVTVFILIFIVAAASALTFWILNRLVDWASEAGLDNRRLPNDIFLWGPHTHRIEHQPLSDFATRFRDRQEHRSKSCPTVASHWPGGARSSAGGWAMLPSGLSSWALSSASFSC